MNPMPKDKKVYSKPLLREIPRDGISHLDHVQFARVKYIYIWDSKRDDRLSYLQKVFDSSAEIELHRMGDSVVPSSNLRTEILIISGNDARRMAQFMKVNELLFTRIPKICLIDNAKRERRVLLYRSGFDAVITTTETPPILAAYHISAIWSRYLLTNQKAMRQEEMLDRYRECCDYDALRDQEKRAFLVLYANRPRTVPFEVLQHEISSDHLPITIEHMRVVLASLRAKLKPGCQLLADRDSGYRLTC